MIKLAVIQASIQQVLREVGPVQSFTLLNSHAHTDHVANNDLIHTVQASEIHHYLSAAGLVQLNPLPHFAVQFYELSAYYDLMTGFQAHRGLTRMLGMVRDVLPFFVGEQRILQLLLPIIFREFQPIRGSRETIQPYEALPRRSLMIGEVPWTGWVLGDTAHDGLTVGQVYAYVQQHQDDPVVQKFLALEFPHTPLALQNVIVVSLLQMGYHARGPRRKKRFYRPARAA